MFGIGMPELLVILLICLLVFGADKLPGIGKALGKTVSEFKKSAKETESTIKDLDNSVKEAEIIEKKS
ncbi:MAG: twin-arginine translocase TatA/TatE family subunit [Candidatus Omnitrophica bacterium]|nr:twin-arginine translocase TatA/TatE family subunit [Candidatus Omnitrophota bacterium]